MRMEKYWNPIFFVLACIVTLTLQCRFEICVGGFADSGLLNGLNKLYSAFRTADYVDLLILAAVFVMLRKVTEREKRLDAGTAVFSFLLAVLLVVCISFRKYNHAGFLLDNSFQLMLSAFCVAGFWILLYLTLRLFYAFMEKGAGKASDSRDAADSFYGKYLFGFGFLFIFLGWLFWIVLNYPGTSCPDSILQLKQFRGEAGWTSAHPPLSSMLMGVLFSVGEGLGNTNFGFFLYCLLQTLVGASVFSLCMKKLHDMGVSTGWCTVGLLFFALSPLWGTYAQWFEKDLLYTEATVLQAVCMLECLRQGRLEGRNALFLFLSGILAALLRNNGIYAIVPALLLLVFLWKGADRRRAVLTLAATVLVYFGVTGVIYPAAGISGSSRAELMSVPFQQTARYVCEYGGEVTDYEREVIDRVLDYEALAAYDPVISDPIKNLYKGESLTEYFKVWFQMFWKHPGCYVSAFINKSFGYLAPVSQNIEGWIQVQYPDYLQELGIYHALGTTGTQLLVQLWNLAQTLPLLKYLCTPGLYTWIVLALAVLLLRHKRYDALILFVPGLVNVLVCLASPLADAIRYELPTVAVTPLLIGWTWYVLHSRQEK